MTKQEYLDYCGTISAAVLDTPFDDGETVAVRHCDTRKWFALVMEHGGKTIVNMKCEPMEADFLRAAYEGVTPAYHMNKVHWNTVYLDSDVPEEKIYRMTMNSFELTKKKSKRSKT